MLRRNRFDVRAPHAPAVHLSLTVPALLLLLAACGAQPFNRGGTLSPTPSSTPPAVTTAEATATTSTAAPSPDETPGTPSAAATPTDAAETGTPDLTPTDAGTSTPTATPPPGYVLYGPGNSNAERAHAILLDQGDLVYLIVVSSASTGVEGDIYRDLRQRNFRTTTGPDEGVDTSTEVCYPNCVYVLAEEINAIGVNSWIRVLQHEYRHITQVKNNPGLARDFRDPNGTFTTYGAFMEACADYGLDVAPVYHAQQRLDWLKNILGADQQPLIDQACSGDVIAYQSLHDRYDQTYGRNDAFEQLFPQYR